MSKVEKIAKMLKDGKIIAFPTDTVFALACSAENDEAIKKIYDLKNRDYSKPLSIFVRNFDELEKIAKENNLLQKLKKQILSGKLTVIVKKRKDVNLSKLINIGDGTIGVRIPNHKLTQQILAEFKAPLVATSVNISGNKEARTRKEVVKYFDKKIDLILDGNCTNGIVSTVVDLTDNEIKIVRKGALLMT